MSPKPFGLLRGRGVRRAGVALVIVALLWLVASWFSVYRVTRRARPPFAEPAPAVSWGRLESLRLPTADGQELGAWFVPGPDSGPSVLLLHGNGESRGSELPLKAMKASHCQSACRPHASQRRRVGRLMSRRTADSGASVAGRSQIHTLRPRPRSCPSNTWPQSSQRIAPRTTNGPSAAGMPSG